MRLEIYRVQIYTRCGNAFRDVRVNHISTDTAITRIYNFIIHIGTVDLPLLHVEITCTIYTNISRYDCDEFIHSMRGRITQHGYEE